MNEFTLLMKSLLLQPPLTESPDMVPGLNTKSGKFWNSLTNVCKTISAALFDPP